MVHNSAGQEPHMEGPAWRKQTRHHDLQADGAEPSPNSTEDVNASGARKRADSIGTSSLVQLQNLAFCSREERQRRSFSNFRSRAALPLGAALIAVLVISTLLLRSALERSVRSAAGREDTGCASRGCQEHLELLSQGLNPDVDPCVNPAAYVCDRVRWTSRLASDAYTDTLARWYEHGATFLGRQRKPASASALYETCLSRESNTAQRLREMLTFLRHRGLHWPRRASNTKHALYVILDLLINWGVHFWFEISLRRLPKDTRYSLSLDYSRGSLGHARWVNYSKSHGQRLKFAQTMYRLYEAGETPVSQIQDLLDNEEAWNRAVAEATGIANSVVMQLRLADLERLTPNVSSERWLAYLNEHLSPHHLLPSDKLLVVDKVATEAINRLFQRFSNSAILDLVAWQFVQDYSFANSHQAALTTFGNEDAVNEFRPRNCYIFTESRFQRALFLERTVAAGSQGRLAVNAVQAIIEDVRNTTQRLLLSPSASSWLERIARQEAAAIVRQMEFEPWQSLFSSAKSELSRTTLKDYLAAFPRSFDSALNGWIEASQIHKHSFPGWPLNDSLLSRHGEYSFLVQYDYWWNSVYVHLAAASAPMFYVDAPASVNYAGIGAAVARQLVRGLDASRGSFLDSQRHLRSWMPRAARRVLYNMTICTGNWGDALMHIAAAQIAYEAYRAHRGAAESNYSVPGHAAVAKFTPDMLFFVSLCRNLCGMGNTCATVLRNMAAFSTAFSCPPHSLMKPDARCTFFKT